MSRIPLERLYLAKVLTQLVALMLLFLFPEKISAIALETHPLTLNSNSVMSGGLLLDAPSQSSLLYPVTPNQFGGIAVGTHHKTFSDMNDHSDQEII